MKSTSGSTGRRITSGAPSITKAKFGKLRDQKASKSAALRFIKMTVKRHGQLEAIVTNGLRSYPAAMRELGNLERREMGRHLNNWAEKFASAVPKTRAGAAQIPPDEVPAEFRFIPCLLAQSF